MNIRFSDLTKNDILNKLDIDFRLIKSFKKVMQKIDKYFDEHSYYEDIEFNHLITEYLKNIYTLKIQVTDGLVEGIYNSYYNTISLNKDLLASSDLEHILCHEFIHFLTSHNYPPLEQVDDVISNCLTEVLTEMLATDIIEEKLEYKCYYDYCILMNYLNEIAGITDYKAFYKEN